MKVKCKLIGGSKHENSHTKARIVIFGEYEYVLDILEILEEHGGYRIQ